jgi:hypothetical protein
VGHDDYTCRQAENIAVTTGVVKRDSGLGTRDSELGIRDSGFGKRDSESRIRKAKREAGSRKREAGSGETGSRETDLYVRTPANSSAKHSRKIYIRFS